MNWKQDTNDFLCFEHSAIRGEHPGVYVIVYMNTIAVHLKIMNYEF